MKVIIFVAITYGKIKKTLLKTFMALEKPAKLGDFFLLLCGHYVKIFGIDCSDLCSYGE